jgi:hypothetical protein
VNDTELKQMLAKMLPGSVAWVAATRWNNHDPVTFLLRWENNARVAVLDTELLHLCSLVEDGLTDKEMKQYIIKVFPWSASWARGKQVVCLTWQERTAALAKVKGIIV